MTFLSSHPNFPIFDHSLQKSLISGRIVNVSSVAGLYGYPGLSAYCATKHAIEAVSSVLRHELVKFDISVVTVQPGDFSKATHLLGEISLNP